MSRRVHASRYRTSLGVGGALLLVGCRALLDFPDDPHLADVEAAAGELPEPRALPAPAAAPAIDPPLPTSPTSSDDAESVSAFDSTGAQPPSAGARLADAGGTPPVVPDAGAVATEGDGAAAPALVVDETPEPSGDGLVTGACAPVTRASINDFTFAPGSSRTGVAFGAGAAFAGATFFYPVGAEDLASDVSGGDWRLSGSVRGTAGFGLVMDCPEIDASSFAGVAFTLWSSPDLASIVFYVETAAHQVSHVWLNDNKATAGDPDAPENVGRCFPEATRYDGTCHEPRVTLPVQRVPTEVRVLWQDLTGGSPEDSVDPSEITSIAWTLPRPADAAYSFEVHVDDLRFIPAAP